MNKDELIKATILGEEHLGENLKGLCIEYIDNLQQENQKYKEVFDKVKKIIMQPNIEIREYHSCDMDYVYVNEQLLDILKEVE